jgi:hypothetical protein
MGPDREDPSQPTECDASTGNGLSMADDNRLRSYRSNDPYRRAAEPPQPSEPAGASDPLAELARLIGQSDPFAEFGRSNQRQAGPAALAPQAQPAPHGQYRPRDDYAQPDSYPASAPARDDWRHAAAQGSSYRSGQGVAQGAREDFGKDWARESSHEQHYAADDYSSRDAHRKDLGYKDSGYKDSSLGLSFPPRGDSRHAEYDDPRLAPDDQHPAEEQYADGQQEELHHAEQQHADAQAPGGRPADENYYQDDVPLEPHEDETYDDAPRARRRGGLVTALALVGCAMLGTAGAYAYRSYVSSPGSSQPPPVITADSSTPTKIVPATSGDPQTSKASQDRLANAGREQVISKQEEPVALRELGTQTTPRVVLPAPVAPSQGAAGSEPKKVRTVTIRPDGTDVSGRPVGALPPATQGPATTTRATTPPAAPKAAAPAPGGRNAPISLEPQAEEPAPRTRTAATPPAARSAPETTANASAGYVVQLSSQKTEAEAQASFRSLQAKFPSELGSRQPLIRRADLGSKGVFYRTMVGPFASAQEASQFCASYKAAGGQCVVPNN